MLCLAQPLDAMLRLLTPLLCVALLWPSGALADFRDVNSKHEYGDSINELFKRRLIRGYPDGNFYPDTRINRVEFVKIVIGSLYESEEIHACLSDITPEEVMNDDIDTEQDIRRLISFESLKFSDVDYDDWYGNYLCMAQLENIVGGYEDNTFRPLQRVNFAEAATILTRAFEVLQAKRHLKPDPIWYKPFVQDLADIRGIPASISGFDYYITRGEMAEMVRRLLDFKEKRLKTTKPFLQYEEISRSGNWTPYENEELGFVLQYSDEWPVPDTVMRGFFDGGIPSKISLWRVFLGPKVTCQGYGECLDRKFSLDGFRATDAQVALRELQEDEKVTIIDDKTVNDTRMILFEYRTLCTQRTALFFGKETLYRLNSLCGGDVPSQARLLQRMIEKFRLTETLPR